MNVPLTGYATTKLLRSTGRGRVYEARREADDQVVIAKVFALEDPGVQARVELEFRLIQELELDGVVRAVGLERVGNQLILLLERVPGVDLRTFAGGDSLSVELFMQIALDVSETLAQIHERGVLHLDIKPSNLIYDSERGRTTFADFGISVLVESEIRDIYDPEVLQGTLPYISPEQTGRTKREVDFRSDLYSLGATFYELVTGRRPFTTNSPLSLIHAHLARVPRPADEHVPGLPSAIAKVIAKLLEKAPEHRYQSARGLLADLREIAHQLARGEVDEAFELGRHDHASSLQMPHQLYGRVVAQRKLERELAESLSDDDARVVLIRGAPGVGKTALLDAFASPVVGRGGYIASGHFVRGEEQRPYRGLIEAITSLTDQLLTEPASSLERWRQSLHGSLGVLAGVVVDLVPPLGLVLGECPPAPPLEPGDVKNRLLLALARLLACVARRGPLVLALDDLQWIDEISLELLRALMFAGIGAPILIIGAHHDELPDDHPLSTLEEELELVGQTWRTIELEALTRVDVSQMLADMLSRSPEEVSELAELVDRKTGNNPLFVRQFIGHVAELGLLRPAETGWTWDAEKIAAAEIPDDVVGVMVAKLERLPDAARQVVERAACLGTRFSPVVLEQLVDCDGAELATRLHEIAGEGLISAVGSDYAFAHPQLREIARERLGADRLGQLQRAIGRAVLASLDEDLDALAFGEEVFGIADHLNAGFVEVDGLDPGARALIARVNAAAGRRALRSAAWAAACRYLGRAVELADALAAGLGFELEFDHAQALDLAGRAEEAEAAFEAMLEGEISPTQHGRLIARRVRLLTNAGRRAEAIEVGLAAVARHGLRIRAEVSPATLLFSVLRGIRAMRRIDLDELRTGPELRDERAAAILEILDAIKIPAFGVSPRLFVYLTGVHAQLACEVAFHPTTPAALAQLAMAMGMGFFRYPAAVALCDEALALTDRPGGEVSRGRVRGMGLVALWPSTRPMSESADQVFPAYREALNLNDFEMAGVTASLGLELWFHAGKPIVELIAQGRKLRAELERWGNDERRVTVDAVVRAAARLAGPRAGDPPSSFVSDDQLEAAHVVPLIRALVAVDRAICAWLLGDQEALPRWRELAPALGRVGRSWRGAAAASMVAILITAECEREGRAARGARRRMRRCVAVAERWEALNDATFAVFADLARAERARLRGRAGQAASHYERALERDPSTSAVWARALAAERLASLAVARGQRAAARGAALTAAALLRSWGADAAAGTIEDTHAELLAPVRAVAAEGDHRVLTTGSVSSGSDSSSLVLDVATVLGTMQVISEQLRLDEVIGRVLASAIASAGADRGVLLLDRDGELGVVAEGDPERTREFLDQPLAFGKEGDRVPRSVINYVLRTGAPVVLDDALSEARFSSDPHVRSAGLRSVLCMPIIKQSERIGALVLENRLTAGAFTADRLEILRILLAQAASAIDNARLYDALRRSEAQWRSLVNGMPDIIALLDRNGRIEFVNHAHLFPGGQAPIGLQSTRLIPPAHGDQWRAALARANAGEGQQELELSVTLRSGELRWYHARITAMEHGGKVGKLICITTDISERRRSEQARLELETQLRQQQRLESIGTLASGVAHEINNPVQGIMNYADLITTRVEDHALVVEFAGEILTESQRVATIVRNLLAFSRQEADATPEIREIRALIEATLSLIRSVIRKDHIDLVLLLDDPVPPVTCRAQQIQQIIMNLVTNARDALNEQTRAPDEREQIEIRAASIERDDETWVRISVRDHGPGIPEEVRPRIFDPFYTTKGRDQGTGLGLAVSHGIAQEHGGELWFESEVGVGTTFHLELPAATPDRSGILVIPDA